MTDHKQKSELERAHDDLAHVVKENADLTESLDFARAAVRDAKKSLSYLAQALIAESPSYSWGIVYEVKEILDHALDHLEDKGGIPF